MYTSDKIEKLLNILREDENYRKILLYYRSMKKAPHGGVFQNSYPNMFLKYYPCPPRYFISIGKIPFPISEYRTILNLHLQSCEVKDEELLLFCFCHELDPISGTVKDTPENAEKTYAAFSSKILSLKSESELKYEDAIEKAITGEIDYLNTFTYNRDRLLSLFLLFSLSWNTYRFENLDDILCVENFHAPRDKYGLSEITTATFERQGYTIDGKFYLYNLFFDTSIGSNYAKVPRTVEVFQHINNAQIYMRRDETLAAPCDKKVIIASSDMQKWRGITLDLEHVKDQIKSANQTIVHYDPNTMHKLLLIVKKEIVDNETIFHVSVEQLWNPDSVASTEHFILTNFVHSCYYLNEKTFDHVDFSINQYCRATYSKKYLDYPANTGIPIESYAEQHYKVWCVKAPRITIENWVELVNCTVDAPFRNLFAESIGAELVSE